MTDINHLRLMAEVHREAAMRVCHDPSGHYRKCDHRDNQRERGRCDPRIERKVARTQNSHPFFLRSAVRIMTLPLASLLGSAIGRHEALPLSI